VKRQQRVDTVDRVLVERDSEEQRDRVRQYPFEDHIDRADGDARKRSWRAERVVARMTPPVPVTGTSVGCNELVLGPRLTRFVGCNELVLGPRLTRFVGCNELVLGPRLTRFVSCNELVLGPRLTRFDSRRRRV
jgi:hypothetical protein